MLLDNKGIFIKKGISMHVKTTAGIVVSLFLIIGCLKAMNPAAPQQQGNEHVIEQLQGAIERLTFQNNLLRDQQKFSLGEPFEKISSFLDLFKGESPSSDKIEGEIESIFGGIHTLKKALSDGIQSNFRTTKIEDLMDSLSAEEYKHLRQGLENLKKKWRNSKKSKRAIDSLEYIIYIFSYLKGDTTFFENLRWMSTDDKIALIAGAAGLGFIAVIMYVMVQAVAIEQAKLEANKKSKEEENLKKAAAVIQLPNPA